jgi:hypothetical protein
LGHRRAHQTLTFVLQLTKLPPSPTCISSQRNVAKNWILCARGF